MESQRLSNQLLDSHPEWGERLSDLPIRTQVGWPRTTLQAVGGRCETSRSSVNEGTNDISGA